MCAARENDMTYSERAFFEGDHCHHCAARDEALRLARLERGAGIRGRRINFLSVLFSLDV